MEAARFCTTVDSDKKQLFGRVAWGLGVCRSTVELFSLVDVAACTGDMYQNPHRRTQANKQYNTSNVCESSLCNEYYLGTILGSCAILFVSPAAFDEMICVGQISKTLKTLNP